jgi:hypothetical protein
MNAVGLTLVAAGAGALLLAGVLVERARMRAFRGPKPTGDRVVDYERELAELRERGL